MTMHGQHLIGDALVAHTHRLNTVILSKWLPLPATCMPTGPACMHAAAGLFGVGARCRQQQQQHLLPDASLHA